MAYTSRALYTALHSVGSTSVQLQVPMLVCRFNPYSSDEDDPSDSQNMDEQIMPELID